jgi:co-chaperonin GroES (HSP10)
MGNRFSKPVALNRASKTDQLIMKHIEGINFSGYVKGLILEDIAKKQANKGVVIQVKKGQKKIIKGE